MRLHCMAVSKPRDAVFAALGREAYAVVVIWGSSAAMYFSANDIGDRRTDRPTATVW